MSLDFFQNTDLFPFEGRGTVERTVKPFYPGRVRFQATYWPARLWDTQSADSLQPGAPVQIVGREGLTLLIKPLRQTG